MTFLEFMMLCTCIPRDQRAGQRAYNLLYKVNESLAKQINGTEIDPFYVDERLPDFFEFVQQHWD